MSNASTDRNGKNQKAVTIRCRFCDVAKGRSGLPQDHVLAENVSYVAIPSVGSLVPGWVLILPRKHQLNLSSEYLVDQLESFRVTIASKLASKFRKRVRLFEHGPAKFGSLTGCGVDHAHMHLVPVDDDLSQWFGYVDGNSAWQSCRLSEVCSMVGNSEYLLYANDATSADPICKLAILQQPASQFFRRCVALAVGQPERFDYKAYPSLHNVTLTNAILREAGSIEQQTNGIRHAVAS